MGRDGGLDYVMLVLLLLAVGALAVCYWYDLYTDGSRPICKAQHPSTPHPSPPTNPTSPQHAAASVDVDGDISRMVASHRDPEATHSYARALVILDWGWRRQQQLQEAHRRAARVGLGGLVGVGMGWDGAGVWWCLWRVWGFGMGWCLVG
jgi:hypothetical protein